MRECLGKHTCTDPYIQHTAQGLQTLPAESYDTIYFEKRHSFRRAQTVRFALKSAFMHIYLYSVQGS
jgi:hypothetical protein